jgi:hypothetical protein
MHWPLTSAWIRAHRSLEADAGQGSLEYIGAVLVAAAVVVVVLSSIAGFNIGSVFTNVVNKITTGK